MNQITLFDVDNAEPLKIKYLSKYGKWKLKNSYMKADSTEICCKNCKHLFANMPNCTGGGKYYKCELLGRSSSAATDVRLSYVCNLWEIQENEK